MELTPIVAGTVMVKGPSNIMATDSKLSNRYCSLGRSRMFSDRGPEPPISSMLPSAGARATCVAPMMPLAPGLFSTTNGTPSCALMPSASTRAKLSLGPPAA
ncbi:hypothetical protein D3C85_1299470 [compost metagenome]